MNKLSSSQIFEKTKQVIEYINDDLMMCYSRKRVKTSTSYATSDKSGQKYMGDILFINTINGEYEFGYNIRASKYVISHIAGQDEKNYAWELFINANVDIDKIVYDVHEFFYRVIYKH